MGNKALGFAEVPSNWVSFKDVDVSSDKRLTQYSDPLGRTILSLSAFDSMTAEQLAQFSASRMKADSTAKVEGAAVTLGELQAYQVYSINSGGQLWVIWTFDGSDNLAHYISLEGFADDSEPGFMTVFDGVQSTYSFDGGSAEATAEAADDSAMAVSTDISDSQDDKKPSTGFDFSAYTVSAVTTNDIPN